ARGELETQVLDAVEALGHEDLGVVGRDLLHDDRERGGALADDGVYEAEASRQRLVEEEPPDCGLDLRRVLDRGRVAVASSTQGELVAVGGGAEPDLGVKGDAPVLPRLFGVVDAAEHVALAL